MSDDHDTAPASPGDGTPEDRERVARRLRGEPVEVGSTLDAAFVHGEHLADSYLVDRARAGSTEAFEVLVVKHRARLYRVARRLAGDDEAAEDICQDAFVAAWRGLGNFRGDAQFSTWMHQIVVNTARTHLVSRRPVVALPEDLPMDRAAEPDRVVQSAARDAALRAAVAALPFDQRAPLVMVQFEGFSYEQAAEVLGLGVSTVRGRIARGRRALLDAMREWR